MRWIVKRKISDMRGEQIGDMTWYFLQKDGSWAPTLSRAKSFSNLHDAERTAAHFSGDAKVEVEQ